MCFEAPAFILFTGQYETNLFISCFMQIQYIAKIAAIFGTYIYNRAEMIFLDTFGAGGLFIVALPYLSN